MPVLLISHVPGSKFFILAIYVVRFIPVGTFIFTFFVGTLKEVWTSGYWEDLFSFKVFFSVSLFAFSLFIPKIIKKLKKEN